MFNNAFSTKRQY